MTQPKQLPLLFTASNRAAIRDRIKTQTRRVKGLEEVIADKAVWDEDNLEWDFYLDGHYQTSHKCPYGNPQVEPVEYWVREPVELLGWGETYPERVRPRYLDDGITGARDWVCITQSDSDRLLNRADWSKPTTALHMLKSFARTWLQGTRTWPEKLGDISRKDAIEEGIELSPNVPPNSIWVDDWRDYLNGGYTQTPVLSYITLWESIHGPGSWNPEQWVWCVEWEFKW